MEKETVNRPETPLAATKAPEFSIASVSRDTLLYLPARVVPAIATVLAIPLFTYFFSTEEYGRYDLALNFVLFVNMLTTVWLEMVILRFYPAYVKKGKEAVYLSVISLTIWGSVTVGLAVLGFFWWLGPDRLVGSYRNMLGIAALAFAAQGFYQSGQSILRARHLPVVFSVAAGINVVAKIVLGLLIAVPLGIGVSGLLWGAALAPALMYLIFMRRHFPLPPLQLDEEQKAFIRELLAYGLPVAAAHLLNFLLMNMDRFLLKYRLGDAGDAVVGVYGIGNFLVGQPLNMAVSTLMLAIMPAVASKYENASRRETEEFVGGLTRVYMLLLVPACIFLWALAQPLFQALTHGEFQQGYDAAPWLTLGWLVLGFRQYGTLGLHLSKRTGLLASVTLLAVAVDLAGCWFLIPKYGYMGCAVMRSVSQGVLLVAGVIVSGRFLKWTVPLASLFRASAASILAALALYWAMQHLPHNIVAVGFLFGAGFGLYGLLLLVFREARWSDFARFTRQVLGRGEK